MDQSAQEMEAIMPREQSSRLAEEERESLLPDPHTVAASSTETRNRGKSEHEEKIVDWPPTNQWTVALQSYSLLV